MSSAGQLSARRMIPYLASSPCKRSAAPSLRRGLSVALRTGLPPAVPRRPFPALTLAIR